MHTYNYGNYINYLELLNLLLVFVQESWLSHEISPWLPWLTRKTPGLPTAQHGTAQLQVAPETHILLRRRAGRWFHRL